MSSSVPGIFDKKINLGTLIEILVLVTGMAFGYRDVTNNQTYLKEQLSLHLKEKEEYVRKDLMAQHDALMTSQLDGIKEDLQRIEKKVEKYLK